MTTVYVLASGSYSDYRVVGVFSSAKKAERFIASVPNSDYNDLETYELDNDAPDMLVQGYHIYVVTMLRDGTTERVERQTPTSYLIGCIAEPPTVWCRSQAPFYKGKGVQDAININVWAKSDEQAIKIVNEKRAQMIAEGKWNSPTQEE